MEKKNNSIASGCKNTQYEVKSRADLFSRPGCRLTGVSSNYTSVLFFFLLTMLAIQKRHGMNTDLTHLTSIANSSANPSFSEGVLKCTSNNFVPVMRP